MTQPIPISFWLSEKAYACLERLSPLADDGEATKDPETGFVRVSIRVSRETAAYYHHICTETGVTLDDLMEAFYTLADQDPRFRSQVLAGAAAVKKEREAKS